MGGGFLSLGWVERSWGRREYETDEKHLSRNFKGTLELVVGHRIFSAFP